MSLNPSERRNVLIRLSKAIFRRRGSLLRIEEEPPVRAEDATNAAPSDGIPLVLPFDKERLLVPQLLKRLRRGRFLRHFPDNLDEYAPLTQDATCYLIDKLHTVNIDAWKESVVAIWALGRLSPQDPARAEAADLLRWIVEPTGGSMAQVDGRRLTKRWRSVMCTLFCFPLCGFVTLWLSRGDSRMFEQGVLFLLVGVALGAFILSVPCTALTFLAGSVLDRERMIRVRAMALLTLGRWREPCHLDLLLRTHVGKIGRERLAAEVALREALPLLNFPADTERSADFVSNLCRALRREEQWSLDHAVRDDLLEIRLLDALGKVGDGSSVPTVERIARRGRTSGAREAAQTVLPDLRARRRQEDDLKQLLRGTVQPAVASGTLLRPAHEIPTPADQLLRSHLKELEPTPIQAQRNAP